jgi:ligand-binding sensor domain-containing protein
MGMRKWIFLFVFLGAVSSHAQPLHEYAWTFYDTSNRSVQNNFITDIEFDSQGRAWVSTANYGLNYYDNHGWHHIKPVVPDSLVYGWFNDLVFINDQTLAIGGIPGILVLYHLKSNHWEYLRIPRSSIQAMEMVGLPGNALLLGGNQGLMHFKNGVFSTIRGVDNGVMGISLHEEKWVDIHAGDGTFRYSIPDDGSPRLKFKSKLTDLAFYRTAVDGKGRLWATSFSGLNVHLKTDTGWIKSTNIPQSAFYNFNGSWQFTAHEMAVLPDGRIMAGSQFMPHLIVNNEVDWETYMVPIKEKFDGINKIVVAPDSSIWIATWYDGVAVFSHKNNKKHKKVILPPPAMSIDPRQQQPDPNQINIPIHKLIDD